MFQKHKIYISEEENAQNVVGFYYCHDTVYYLYKYSTYVYVVLNT